jgi:hypothetical protein
VALPCLRPRAGAQVALQRCPILRTSGKILSCPSVNPWQRGHLYFAKKVTFLLCIDKNLEVKLTFFEGEPLDVELPTSVDLKIVQADVAVRGDTATGVTKRVQTETGLTVQVPNFVEEGDTIRVDTRNGNYLTRV